MRRDRYRYAGPRRSIARAAIGHADTLVTPMNDSFVDLDLIGQVHPENYKITKPSFYAELIWNSRTQRAKATGKSVDWVVLRTASSISRSHNLAASAPRSTNWRGVSASGSSRGLASASSTASCSQGLTLLDLADLGEVGQGHCRPSGVARDDRGVGHTCHKNRRSAQAVAAG